MEHWTDKKRGFVEPPGSLISQVGNLSFARSTKEALGNLFQTVAQRETPDGTITVRGFGKYEKVYPSPKKVEAAPPPDREMLVMFVQYTNNPGLYQNNDIISLIAIGGSGYTVIKSFDARPLLGGGYAISVSWNYDKNCFIVLSTVAYSYVYDLYEITLQGVATLKARYENAADWYTHPGNKHDDPHLFVSYGSEGREMLPWIGFGEYYYGYYYLLPLTKHYLFGSYDPDTYTPSTIMSVAKSDCESFHHATWNVPTLSWLTHDNVRIIKMVDSSAGNWYGQVYQRVCEAKDKAACIYDLDIQNGNAPMAIRLTSSKWKDVKVVDRTPSSYLNFGSDIKASNVFSTGSYPSSTRKVGYYNWLSGAPSVSGFFIVPFGDSGTYTMSDAILYGYSNTWVMYLRVASPNFAAVYWPIMVSWSEGQLETYGFTLEQDSFPQFTDPANNFWINGATGLVYWRIDTDKVDDQYYLLHSYDEFYGSAYHSLIVTITGSLIVATAREEYTDIRYINNHYVVVGSTAANDQRVFATKNGPEIYEIPLGDPGECTVKLERVIVRGG